MGTSIADVPWEAVFAWCNAHAEIGTKYLQGRIQKSLRRTTGLMKNAPTWNKPHQALKKSTFEVESGMMNKICMGAWLARKTLALFLWRCASAVYKVKCAQLTGTALCAKWQKNAGQELSSCWLIGQFTDQKQKKKKKGGGRAQILTGHTFLICVHHKGLVSNARAEP